MSHSLLMSQRYLSGIILGANREARQSDSRECVGPQIKRSGMRPSCVTTSGMLALLLWALICTGPAQGVGVGHLGSEFRSPGTEPAEASPGAKPAQAGLLRHELRSPAAKGSLLSGPSHRGPGSRDHLRRGRVSPYGRGLRGAPTAISRGVLAPQYQRQRSVQRTTGLKGASTLGSWTSIGILLRHGVTLGPGATSARRVLAWRLHPAKQEHIALHENRYGGRGGNQAGKGRHSHFACDCPLLTGSERGGRTATSRRRKGESQAEKGGGKKGKRRISLSDARVLVTGNGVEEGTHGFRSSTEATEQQDRARGRPLLAVGGANTTKLAYFGGKGRSLEANDKGCTPPLKGHHSHSHQQQHQKQHHQHYQKQHEQHEHKQHHDQQQDTQHKQHQHRHQHQHQHPHAPPQCTPRSRRELAREAIAALVRHGYTKTAKYLRHSQVLMRLRRPATLLAPSNEAYREGNLPQRFFQSLQKHPGGGAVSGRLMAYHTLTKFRGYRQLMGQVPTAYRTALPRTFLRSFRRREYYSAGRSLRDGTHHLLKRRTEQYYMETGGHQRRRLWEGRRGYAYGKSNEKGLSGRRLWESESKLFRNVLGFGSLQGAQDRTTLVKHKNLFCNALVIIQGVSCLLIPPKHFPSPPQPVQHSPHNPAHFSPPSAPPHPRPQPTRPANSRAPPPAPPPGPQTPLPALAPVPVASGPSLAPLLQPEPAPSPGPRLGPPLPLEPAPLPSAAPNAFAPLVQPESSPVPGLTVSTPSPLVIPPRAGPAPASAGGPGTPPVPYIPQPVSFPSAPPHVPSPSEGPVSPFEPTEAPLSSSPEAPSEAAPLEAPSEGAPLEAPSEAAPLEAPSEGAPLEAPSEGAPLEAPSEGPPSEAPSGVPVEAPAGAPVQAPSELPTGAPVDSPLEGPADSPVQAPTESPIQAPVEPQVQAPTEAPIEAPVLSHVQAPEESPVQAPSEAPG